MSRSTVGSESGGAAGDSGEGELQGVSTDGVAIGNATSTSGGRGVMGVEELVKLDRNAPTSASQGIELL